MSRRRELARRLAALTDIAGILSAMKNLALIETRLLAELVPGQHHMVAAIEATAADFLAWHARPTAPAEGALELCVVVGSEQGFCGDYNEALAERLRAERAAGRDRSRWVVVGRRLEARLGESPDIAATLPGATVADEVPVTLLRLTAEVGRLLAAPGSAGCGLSALYHCVDRGAVRLRPLLPLRDLPPPPARAYAPELDLPPAEFLAGLTGHYLYAALNEVIYSGLLAENRQRQAHMDRALQRLDEETGRLRRAANAQRQEEITEEIEVLLLSGEALQD